MTTLADIALTVATQLGRVDANATQILDLENEIKAEIKNAVRFYNRKPSHLTEVRGGTLTTEAGTTWYSTVQSGVSYRHDSSLVVTIDSMASTLDVDEYISTDQIVKFHYMRENPGASGLNEPLSMVPYTHFERMFEGSTPQGQPEYFTVYAGKVGIWPTPNAAHTLYWSGIVKPGVPIEDTDESVWFFNANELIEAATARRVCSKYLRDPERAQMFAADEMAAWNALQAEHVNKSSTGRLKSHD